MWWDRWAGEEVTAPSLKVFGLIWGRKMDEMSLPGPFQTCFLRVCAFLLQWRGRRTFGVWKEMLYLQVRAVMAFTKGVLEISSCRLTKDRWKLHVKLVRNFP